MKDIQKRPPVRVGGIEAGGTKFVCGVGTGPGDLDRTDFPTGTRPEQVLERCIDWLREREERIGSLAAIGIGSFGPIDLEPESSSYGTILSTPKPGWQETDILGFIRTAFPDIPVAIGTDVGAAALGEAWWGVGTGLSDFVYITIGTGIGAGAIVGGDVLRGLLHPEMGHMLLPRVAGDDFPGACPFHGACWEGLCSGPALQARTGLIAEELPAHHEAWDLETRYVAYGLANITCTLSPQRLILGGSVPKGGRLGEAEFMRRTRATLREALADYITLPPLQHMADYLVRPALGDSAGVCGAMALGQIAAHEHSG